jgi:hypothetical protein
MNRLLTNPCIAAIEASDALTLPYDDDVAALSNARSVG